MLQQQPDNSGACYVKGVCQHCLGQHAEARSYVERAIELNPQNKHYYLTQGSILSSLGDADGARAAYDRALALDPGFPEVLNNLGALNLNQRRFVEAESCFRRALAGNPRFAEASCNLGVVAAENGRTEEAIEHYRVAIELRPDYPEAQNNLANALNALGKFARAVEVLQPLVERHPHFAAAHNALGSALFSLGDHQQARASFERALEIEPDFSEALGNVANVFSRDGDSVEARRVYENALKLNPTVPKVHFNYAMVLLGCGDYAAGWPEYEWRLRAADWLWAHPWFRDAGPLWDGSVAPGSVLVVRAEQGFGDVIQFARFLPRAKERVGTLVLEAPRSLERLLGAAPGVDRFVVADSDRIVTKDYDFFVPIMSLPHRLGIGIDTLPGSGGYLSVPPVPSPLPALSAVEGLKVGIVWAGSAGHREDRRRSCSAGMFRRLLEVEGICLFSLQVGERADEVGELGGDGRVVDLSGQLTDFAATAEVIGQLDLVVAVDTAVVHLAGALGKECWVLLATSPDWRWLESGATTAWYDRATLFRQPQAEDWNGVFDAVVERLARFRVDGGVRQ
ncbi:tetratricopeptide repeat protein [Endothiovibrio diazotrophicus]